MSIVVDVWTESSSPERLMKTLSSCSDEELSLETSSTLLTFGSSPTIYSRLCISHCLRSVTSLGVGWVLRNVRTLTLARSQLFCESASRASFVSVRSLFHCVSLSIRLCCVCYKCRETALSDIAKIVLQARCEYLALIRVLLNSRSEFASCMFPSLEMSGKEA